MSDVRLTAGSIVSAGEFEKHAVEQSGRASLMALKVVSVPGQVQEE